MCLHKLYSAIKFEPAARENALAAVFGRLGIDDEAGWSAARATWLRNGVARFGESAGSRSVLAQTQSRAESRR